MRLKDGLGERVDRLGERVHVNERGTQSVCVVVVYCMIVE